ncbi:amidohydrolase family protein [Microbacterium sp. ZW T5_56]|uniref:amidohydrolase family protein n=1 Tax=Microbacterium sp. ZW T5_56 TaxID=3378081 RepID=UPI003851F467
MSDPTPLPTIRETSDCGRESTQRGDCRPQTEVSRVSDAGTPPRHSPRAHLDAHVHLWDVDAFELPWFRADLDLPPRVLIADLEGANPAGVGAVAVQAANTLREFTWLEDETSTAARPVRLVGQYEPSADGWAGVLQPRWRHLAGVRLAAGSARADLSDFAGLDQLAEGLSEHGLVLELLLRPEQLPAATALAARHPALRTVLCHLGLGFAEPDVNWYRALADFASLPAAHAKVSGVIHHSEPNERLRRIVAHARESFGARRLLFGSDWPMSARVAPHETIVALTAAAWGEDATDADDFWGATARRLYGF